SDQVALACAVQRLGAPYGMLPVGLNFPTHTRVHREVTAAGSDIRVLHYHGNVDPTGFLYRAICPLADPYIEKYNRFRAATLELPYDGARSRPLRALVQQR